MDYYLYSHSNADGIFYIGKGCKDRKDHYYKSRSKEWQDIADKGYTTKIEANGNEKDILSLEKIVIKSLVEQGIKLVNKFHNPNWEVAEETKQKISDAHLGLKRTDEVKQKISDANSGENHHMFGKKHSDEVKQKMSDANSGENNPMFGKKNPALGYAVKKRWQHYRLAKANNYRREGE